MPVPEVTIGAGEVQRAFVSVTQIDIGDYLIITEVRVKCTKCWRDLLGEGDVRSWTHECRLVSDAGA